jgi:hypothetical protein
MTRNPTSTNPQDALGLEIDAALGRIDGVVARIARTSSSWLGHQPLTSPPPDGLRTSAEAARKLHCSISTLKGHVASGALRYVDIGHGKKRLRRMFTDADLDNFIANQTRKDAPCPSDAIRARRSGNTASKSEVVAFSALRRRRPGAKPKE